MTTKTETASSASTIQKTNSVLCAHAYSIHYPVAKMQRHLTNGNQTWHQIHTLSYSYPAPLRYNCYEK